MMYSIAYFATASALILKTVRLLKLQIAAYIIFIIIQHLVSITHNNTQTGKTEDVNRTHRKTNETSDREKKKEKKIKRKSKQCSLKANCCLRKLYRNKHVPGRFNAPGTAAPETSRQNSVKLRSYSPKL